MWVHVGKGECVHSQTVCTRFVTGRSLWIRKQNAHVWVHVGKGVRAFSDSVYTNCWWSFLVGLLRCAHVWVHVGKDVCVHSQTLCTQIVGGYSLWVC